MESLSEDLGESVVRTWSKYRRRRMRWEMEPCREGEDRGERMSSRGERCGVVVGVREGVPRCETGGEEEAVKWRRAMVTMSVEVW